MDSLYKKVFYVAGRSSVTTPSTLCWPVLTILQLNDKSAVDYFLQTSFKLLFIKKVLF